MTRRKSIKDKFSEKRKCHYCHHLYTATRAWQLFCGEVCKNKWHYENHTICFYCGDVGYHRDHIEPVSIVGFCKYKGVETARACVEDNLILRDNSFPTIEERLEYLILKIIDKYDLGAPISKWNDEELDELGPNLRAHIDKRTAERFHHSKRLLYMLSLYKQLIKDNPTYKYDIDKPLTFLQLIEEKVRVNKC